jgi:DNA-directed DNA polymerase III PolC
MSDFTPLRVRSHGSLLYGTAAPEALIARALELGYDALALTDRDNLYLAIRFWQQARAEGLRPLLGATLTDGHDEVLLLAATREGFAGLCASISAKHLEDDFDLVATLATHAAGLEMIVEAPPLAEALLAAGVPTGRVALGVRGIASERTQLARRAAAARRLGVPLVATGDVVMLVPAGHDAHCAAVTAGQGELLDRMAPAAFAARDAWFASSAEWTRRVRALCAAASVPEAAEPALAANRALAERMRLHLDLGAPIFPHAPVPDGETGPEWLARLGEAGVIRRYGQRTRAARARLHTELAMIERLGFTSYFLLVAEIMEFARARGIPSVGRGSGASSIVAYVLGITNVDPLRHGLTFERFLNPGRTDCPDLDIDLCWQRRDEVIAHVYDTYGHDRVAMISTHATLGARSAFRETAKVLGVPNARMNVLARRVPHTLARPYRAHLERLPDARFVDWSEPVLARALTLAEQLEGAPRHLSVHSGGVVIADRPLTWYVPLEPAAKGVVVTQFEMRAIEAIGLVKMDLLGNRALSTIAECVTLARAHRATEIDVDRIADPDPATSARLAAGDTLNCFQLESPAMRHLLRMFDAHTLDETIAAVAAVRPGPAEMGLKEALCRRKRGLEPVTFHHPALEPVLGATHGLMLYEEDVMHVAAAIAGLSLAEGDDLRRAIGRARTEDEFRSLERGFVAHARTRSVTVDAARAVWRDLTRFAAYAFCKAHAAGYGTLGWHSVYLKTHFATEWAVGVLNHHAGMYATWVHVEDLRRRGVTFRGPCVWNSAWQATLETGTAGSGHLRVNRAGLGAVREPDAEHTGAVREPGAVRVGLSRVFGLARATADRILAERRAREWRSLADFAERARPTLPELEALILAGALDRTCRARPALLLEARVLAATPGATTLASGLRGRPRERAGRLAARRTPSHAAGRAPQLAASDGAAVMPEPVTPVAIAELPEFDLAERVRGECRSTGLWFSAHPLDVWLDPAARIGATPAAEIERHVGGRVVVTGLPCAYRRIETRAGGLMLFVSIADQSGLAECVLFPDAYRRWADAVRGEILSVAGRVDDVLGAITLTVERIIPQVASGARPAIASEVETSESWGR